MTNLAVIRPSPPQLADNSPGKCAFQLDFFTEIAETCNQTEAPVRRTPAPPNHDGGISSTMISAHATFAPRDPQVLARATYPQPWAAYNRAQTHEQERFVELLKRLCEGIPQPPQKMGRPRLALSDTLFAAVYKTYTMMSGRRFMSDLRDAQDKGLVGKAPSFTSTFRTLENPEVGPILKMLIEQSSLPLASVETEFAADSTGFATSTYARWFDHKWGKEHRRQTWVKTHLMVGVKTNVVTSVEATPYESNDAAQFPKLVAETAKHFTINEVTADKAYGTRRNYHAVDDLGATAYIPFKSNATGRGGHSGFDPLWHRMYAYYQFQRDDFMAHYHRRSNAETTMFMIKSKFGASVRSKTPVAQVNEVLCKVLAHNIVVLVSSIYELGIEPYFWNGESEGLLHQFKSLFPMSG